MDDEECPSCGVDLCSDCGNPLDPEDEVCALCGAEFAFSCPSCDKDLPSDADVCPHCGFEFEEDDEDE
jgi:predicted amidophosphoribosyltransferase